LGRAAIDLVRSADLRHSISAYGQERDGILSAAPVAWPGQRRLAAITAAICMSPEAHADPAKRYTAPLVAGVLYTLLGLAGGAVVGLLAAFPKELVAAVAGLALLGTIAGGLSMALRDERHRDAAALTFLVTLSGVSVAGVGSAFWGVVAGSFALAVQHWRPGR
jgi:benzoate membrane transport protein